MLYTLEASGSDGQSHAPPRVVNVSVFGSYERSIEKFVFPVFVLLLFLVLFSQFRAKAQVCWGFAPTASIDSRDLAVTGHGSSFLFHHQVISFPLFFSIPAKKFASGARAVVISRRWSDFEWFPSNPDRLFPYRFRHSFLRAKVKLVRQLFTCHLTKDKLTGFVCRQCLIQSSINRTQWMPRLNRWSKLGHYWLFICLSVVPDCSYVKKPFTFPNRNPNPFSSKKKWRTDRRNSNSSWTWVSLKQHVLW